MRKTRVWFPPPDGWKLTSGQIISSSYRHDCCKSDFTWHCSSANSASDQHIAKKAEGFAIFYFFQGALKARDLKYRKILQSPLKPQKCQKLLFETSKPWLASTEASLMLGCYVRLMLALLELRTNLYFGLRLNLEIIRRLDKQNRPNHAAKAVGSYLSTL